ncbi:MAG: DUF1295 domain-containing protein [Nitratireductor sp.]
MNILLITFITTLFAFFMVWLASVKMKDAGIVDFYWGPGFALNAWIGIYFVSLAPSGPLLYAQYAFALLITLWAVRLTLQLVLRHINAKHEDARYLKMRKKGGEGFWIASLYKIFLPQAIIQWLISSTILAVFIYAPNFAPSDALALPFASSALFYVLFFIGFIIFAAGLVIESIADWQMFKAKASLLPNTTYTGGLWFYARHPNYLGEIIAWAGLSICAFALCAHPIVFFGPAFLAFVICFISQSITQKHLEGSRKDYAPYLKSTPRILPNIMEAFKPFASTTK